MQIISIPTAHLLTTCDEWTANAASQRECKAIDTACEMLMTDYARTNDLVYVQVDELDGEYRVESRTTPGRFYDVTVDTCECVAHLAHQPCWHRKYVQLLERLRAPVRRQKRTREKAQIEREMAELFN